MQFHKQIFLHKPEKGQNGDCFRTVLACLLDIDPEEVPHFMDVPEETPAREIWKSVDKWLDRYDLRYIAFAIATDDINAYLKQLEEIWPGIRFELAGKSPRGTTHSVIVENGTIVHDPHPDGGGLVGPDERSGQYFMGFLVPIKIHGIRPRYKEKTMTPQGDLIQ